MPVIKSAIKKLRRDRKREKINDAFRYKLDRAINEAKKKKSAASVSAAFSLIDKAVKNDVIHKNRAARIKTSLSKLARPGTSKGAKPTLSTKTKTVKKVKSPAKKSGTSKSKTSPKKAKK
jgi:small subunit ribosomal protein S20